MDIVEVFEKWPTQNDCLAYLEQVRWQGTPKCPYCKSDNFTPLPKEHRYHCNNCNTSFSVTVHTIFHKTHMPLQKWFLAVTLILNAKKGVSARQLARHLHVNRNTAWRISMQIRDAMYEPEQRHVLQGLVKMDETYVGGKPRKDGTRHKRGRGTSKTPVVGMKERGGNVIAEVVNKDNITFKKLSRLVRETLDVKKSVLVTDEARFYCKMSAILPHASVNHQVQYADGWIHTNSIESFWALLKRGIVGQFHKVSIKHLPKYLNEFCYRQNHREHTDVFGLTIQRAIGVA